MTNSDERMTDALIKNAIRSMPDTPAPHDMSRRVMAQLGPKKISLWTRFMLWLTRPKSMTYTPLQVAPVVVCALALIGLAFLKGGFYTEEGPVLEPVRFVLQDQGQHAKAVSVIGSFNGWQAEGSNMWFDNDTGAWVLEAMLPPGRHEYIFLINGNKLLPDPQATMAREDGFGNKNSIIFVDGPDEQAL